MAKKKSTRSKNPMTNKNSAIRRVIKRNPTAKVGEVLNAVKDEFGHKVSPDRILMEKTKKKWSPLEVRPRIPGRPGTQLEQPSGSRQSRLPDSFSA